ncbi:MAG: phosphotransferase family protein [Reyranellaceae bacterium]
MDQALSEKLQAALTRHLGRAVAVSDLARLTGGATKSTYAFTAEAGGRQQRLIMQLTSVSEHTDPQVDATPRLDGASDARLMLAAAANGVQVPKVVCILEPQDGLGSGYVTEFVEGQTLGAKISRDPAFIPAHGKMTEQAGIMLARIHAIDPAAVPFLARQDAADQVRVYRRLVEHYPLRLPALAFGLRWAERNVPERQETRVIHGDFRNGNLIATPEHGIRAVLDWEIGQRGDPMQDLGWFCVKTWRFGGAQPAGGFGSREALFAAYEREAGRSVDVAAVRFWEAFGSIKWAVMCLRKGMLYAEPGQGISLEQCAIGRRIEEPLYDFLNLIEGRD